MTNNKPMRSLKNYWREYMSGRPIPADHRRAYRLYMRDLRNYKSRFTGITLLRLSDNVKNLAKARGCDNRLLVDIAAAFGVVVA